MTRDRQSTPPPAVAVFITCEHGGNTIPVRYRQLFEGATAVLNSHRGWDPGALELAEQFALTLHAPLYSATISRLLVELNRSAGHPQLFSEYTDPLNPKSKSRLLDEHWYPYRQTVEIAIANKIATDFVVVHLSVHSFTPVWNGTPRTTDVGLLFDPARHLEADFCKQWQTELLAVCPDLTVHHNAPYLGTDDGFVTALRQTFSANRYIGLELEVNQKLLVPPTPETRQLSNSIIHSFQQTTASW